MSVSPSSLPPSLTLGDNCSFKSRVYQKAGGAAVNYGWLVYPPRSAQGEKTSFLTSAAKGPNSTKVTVHSVILFINTLNCTLCSTYKDQTFNFHPFCSPRVRKLTKLIKTEQLRRKQRSVTIVAAVTLTVFRVSCSVYILRAVISCVFY